MKEQLETRLQERVKMLYRYTSAMESGDIDVVAAILAEAQYDSVLERMILEVNEVYQIEDRTVVHPDDAVMAQEIVLPTFMDNTNTSEAGREAVRVEEKAVGMEEKGVRVGEKAVQARLYTTGGGKWYRSRTSWVLGAVAAMLIALLVLPGTGALANQFLSLFRVQQFQAVPTVERPEQLMNEVSTLLRNFGTVQWNNELVHANSVGSTVASVEKALGFQPQLPTTLPDGVGQVPQFSVSSSEDVTFTFDRATAEAYLQKTGQSGIAIPASLNEAQFDVKLSNGLAVVYYDHCQTATQDGTQKCTSGQSSLGIGEIPEPVISAQGNALFSDLRGFLLLLPKLSPDIHNLIAHTDVKSGVVPVPIPNEADAQQVTVNGVPGLSLAYGNGHFVIWQKQGVVYLITGYGISNDQLLSTANSFR
jgi:hypothetical protein